MKVWDIFKDVGASVLSMHPAGKAAVSIANAFLGDDEKLDPDVTTGDQAQAAINELPAEMRDKVYRAEIKAEVEHDKQWTQRFEVMNTKSMSWVRPTVVLIMAGLVGFTIVEFLLILDNAIAGADSKDIASIVRELGEAWPTITAILAIPSFVIRAWFGHREQGKQRAAELAAGKTPEPMQGILSSVIKAFKS